MKKGDLFVILGALITSGVIALIFFLVGNKGNFATVYVDNKIYGTYSLEKDDVITIENNGELNVLDIKNGSIQMTEADCPGRDCVKMGAINKNNQSIICLPRKIVVVISSPEESKTDADTY